LSFWAEVHYNSIYPEGGTQFAFFFLVIGVAFHPISHDFVNFFLFYVKCRVSNNGVEEKEEVVAPFCHLIFFREELIWFLLHLFSPFFVRV
jgi:hypothetical protein